MGRQADTIPKLTRKNISGLAYKIVPSHRWNATAFAKHYHQYNQGAVSENTDGVGNYVQREKEVSALGYGAACLRQSTGKAVV